MYRSICLAISLNDYLRGIQFSRIKTVLTGLGYNLCQFAGNTLSVPVGDGEPSYNFWRIEAEAQLPAFHRRHFQMHFLNENRSILIKISVESILEGPIRNKLSLGYWMAVCHGPLTRYAKLQVAHAPGMPGTFSPAADFEGNRYLAIPACITARAWRTCRDACRDRLPAVTGKTFPAFPAHAHPQFCVSGKRPMAASHYLNQ